MGKITFHVDLDNRVKKDGTQNIQLRITQAKKKLRVAVGFSVQKIHWNDEKKEVRRTHPLHSQINKTIKSKLLKVERTYLKSQVTSRKVTASTLQKQLKKEIAGESFVQYSKLRAQQITNPSSRSACKSVLSNLDVYLKGKDLLFEEIDYDWIKDYERYLKKLSNATNTIYNNLKPLKASYNEAIKSGLFEPDKMSPWIRYEGKKAKSVRTRLTIEQIALLEKLNLRPGTNKFQAHNFFLFSFYLQGMRVSDALQLKWANIINGRLEYKASKTEKSRSKKIIQKAAEILNIYRKPRQKPTENIFPFLKDLKESQFADDVWRKKLEAATSVINNELKDIASMIGVSKLTTHIARHSFAEIAKQKTGGYVAAVSAALDHSSIAIATAYFKMLHRQKTTLWLILFLEIDF